MSISRKLLATLVALGVVAAVVLTGCGRSPSASASTQLVGVKRGNLTVSTTGTGNLALAKTADLTFDMAGTVLAIKVQEGDSVTRGQELATLDTTDWEKQIDTLTNALTTAQRNLRNASSQIDAATLNVRQAELNLQSAQNTVSSIPQVRAAQDLVDSLERALQDARNNASYDPGTWAPRIESISQQLNQAQQNLKEVLSGTSFNLSSDVLLQIQQAELKVDQMQKALNDANAALDDARQGKIDAQKAVSDAQKALDDAKALSPVITAPFDGFVTKINVAGGDDIKKGQVIMQVADPARFEADILVSENDIFNISVGSNATVQVDALSSLVLPARVTYISPTATIQQGVVNYKVTVEVENTPQVSRPQSGASGNVTSSQIADRLQQAVRSGQMTQEQADALLKQLQSGSATLRPPTGGLQSGAQVPSMPALKQGLSVTVNIITAQRTNVLLVPNDAISRKGGTTVVTVRKDGQDTQKQVVTGISDWQNTEIVSGLNEGDQVVITRTTTSSSSSSQQRSNQFRVPGGGGMVVR